ncbi:MAG: arginine--tRNA ligase [Pseudobacteriovorax sp.]|nr:arginine--tRNA ligase [Pseudobacteriovorax sp.]
MSKIDVVKEQVAAELALVLKKAFDQDVDSHLAFLALERPKNPQHGDYACPCFRFSKLLGSNPKDISAKAAEAINSDSLQWLSSAEAVGPFLNIRLNTETFANHLLPGILSGDLNSQASHSGEKVMIEYSQPNTHKAFHVGHMRNVALGDSLGRLYKHCGYDVVMVNYIGDEGAHIAKCIWYMEKVGEQAPETGKGEWLGKMYAGASNALDLADAETKKELNEEVSEVLRRIESKSGATYEFWKESREWSISDFEEIYEWTNAHFDHWFSESEVSEDSQKIVTEFLDKGVFVEDQGAIGLDLKDDKLGFVLLRKRDGNTLYATKDLALARKKYDDFNIQKSIYVVASEQNLHFKQVFKTLEKMGFEQAKDCFHLSYGMVVGPDGKMSSRKGNQIIFRELKESMEAAMKEKLEKYVGVWSEEELAETTRRLCVGAIRYGMICSDPVKDIVFSMPDWLSFEGNTGPYLMYAYARTQSILEKAEKKGLQPSVDSLKLLVHEDESELMIYLNDFESVIQSACEANRLSSIAHHLFDMAKVYSRMLSNVSIINAESSELAGARLTLIASFARVLKTGLYILGMEPPRRM